MTREVRDAARPIPVGVGRWGMYEFVEPRVRALVAEHLGLGLEELVSEVSLRDELAADSLDLVELSLAIETMFAITLPNGVLERTRTYSDLVRAVGFLVLSRDREGGSFAEPPIRMSIRIGSPSGESRGTFEWSGWLTPYAAETIAENALRAANGALVEMTVAAPTPAQLAQVEHEISTLSARGVHVTIRRDDWPSPSGGGVLVTAGHTVEGEL